MEDYITLQQAAEIAGYRDAATLRIAANKGRLRTVKPSPLLHMTTRAWLDEYLASLRGGAYRRGQERGPRHKPEDAGEAEA
jgi:hypothetical protein